MITAVEFLCRAKPVITALQAGENPDIPRFTEEMNHWIHGYGSLGYEESERCSLLTARRMTEEDAAGLLRQIRETNAMPRDSLKVEEIDKIPSGLGIDFARDSEGGAPARIKAEMSPIKYGLLRAYQAVGFVSGEVFSDKVALTGLFIRRDYRKKGHAMSLLQTLMDVAKEKGLAGICSGDLSLEGQCAMMRFGKYLEDKGIGVEYDSGWEAESLRTLGHVLFKEG
jgi:GNAT superfamily N-acetyltransferase